MKEIKITFLEQEFEELKSALRWDGKEKAAYALCNATMSKGRAKLMPHTIIPIQDSEYENRSPVGFTVIKRKIDAVFNQAIRTGSDINQCHIHPGDYAHYSPIDEYEEPRFMRHISEKIDGMIHASIVFGNSLNTLDSWFYDRQTDQLRPVQKVVVIKKEGVNIYVPPRSPLKNNNGSVIGHHDAMLHHPR